MQVVYVDFPEEYSPSGKENIPQSFDTSYNHIMSIETATKVYRNQSYSGDRLVYPLSISDCDKTKDVIYWVSASWLKSYLQVPDLDDKVLNCQSS